MTGRTQSIANFLGLGFNVIADDVVWERAWLEETLRLLAPYRVYYVGVHCDDAVSARRERERGDRHAGWARGSGRMAHQDATYDLTIDTSHESPERCAARIKAALDGGLAPTAMDAMQRRFGIDPC
jgi:chloramphenicol 3-O phosphotransferase